MYPKCSWHVVRLGAVVPRKETAISFIDFAEVKGRKKSPAQMRGFFFYLLRPEPAPVGVSVDPLGEALGPRVFPDGLWVLFGEVTVAPAFPVVVPFIDEPVALPVAAEPPAAELPPAEPAAEPPPLCASAKVLESASAVANAIVLSFIISSLVCDRE
jgi:hypothetical protein